MAVSRRLRFEILRRDSHTCRYCGAAAPDVKLTVDHVVPGALGGSDDPSNLVTACESCNGGKTSIAPDSPLVQNVAGDALRWAGAIRTAANQMLADLDQRNELRDEFDDAWSSWGIGEGKDRKEMTRPPGWRDSIDSFMAAGLPMPVLLDCMEKAMGNQKVQPKDTFRYMCGIAWKKVTELQEAAHGIARRESAGIPADTPDSELFQRMYADLVSHTYGVLSGVSSESDARTMAEFHRDTADPDDEQLHLDDHGLAAAEVIDHAAALIAEHRETVRLFFRSLPKETFDEFSHAAIEQLVWPVRLVELDRGHLYRDFLLARAFKLAIESVIGTPEGGQEASE